MAVRVTHTAALRKSFATPASFAYFIRAFELWREDWPANEYESEFFGKDGAYGDPPVNGRRNQLLHVHLKPVQDHGALARWMTLFRRRSRKTSDRALVYVHSKLHGFLLIYILEEPTAHEVARMQNDDHARIMQSFAEIAGRFIDTGKVIA